MISRKSAKLIADAYGAHFRSSRSHIPFGKHESAYYIKDDELNVFLFEHEFDSWFLAIVRKKLTNGDVPQLLKVIMELHTGETIVSEALGFDWKQAEGLGQKILIKLATDIFKHYETIPIREVDLSKARDDNELRLLKAVAKVGRPADELLEKLRGQLEIDGYVYRDGTLFSVESSVVDTQAELSYLEILIDSVNLSDPVTIKHHIKLAEEHYVNGRYGDSIGNSRHFLEAILAQVLEGVSTKLGRNLNPAVYKNATTTRDHLEREGLISAGERDTLKQIYGLLSNTGGHAYIAQKDQARLMWHLALTCSQFVLLRYEGLLKANP